MINDFTTPDKITDKVYLGKSNSAKNLEILKKIGITHILIVGYDLEIVFPDSFVYKKIEIDDKENANICSYFQEANDFINCGEKVLVHCHAGVSRSATIVIAYLMNTYKIDITEAISICKKGRSCINPNRGFMFALNQYNMKLKQDFN